MLLYLFRHAHAADAAANMPDADRPLTAEGCRDFSRALRGLKRLNVDIELVFTSPLTRARQTAAIVAEELCKLPDGAVHLHDSLAPPGRLDAFLSHLRHLPAKTSVAAVGHEPIMSDWIGRICFGASGRCRMKKGAVAAIELDVSAGRGELLFLLQPAAMRKL